MGRGCLDDKGPSVVASVYAVKCLSDLDVERPLFHALHLQCQ